MERWLNIMRSMKLEEEFEIFGEKKGNCGKRGLCGRWVKLGKKGGIVAGE